MAKINGKLFRIYIVDTGTQTAIPLESTSSFSIENAVIDASDKDSGGYLTQVDGQRSWSVDGTFNYDQTRTDLTELIDKIVDADNSTEIEVLVGQNATSGDLAWSGNALIGSVSFSEDNNALVTVDISLTGNSPLTKVTKA